jgi:integrase/recombinase XerD
MRETLYSIPVGDWPEADRLAWKTACRPGVRLKAGGPASHLAPESREDYERRYGADRLNENVVGAGHVTPGNVESYLADLKARVSSVTIYNCISKLRRVAKVIAPEANFGWLSEIENDLALTMQPRSKFERFVLTQCLVQAGLDLVDEGKISKKDPMSAARMVRKGLMIAQLGLCPIRLKNFAALAIGQSFRQDQASWWIMLTKKETKTHRADERRVPDLLCPAIDFYLARSRPVLLGKSADAGALWISSGLGGR